MPLDIGIYMDKYSKLWTEQGAALVLSIIERLRRDKISPDRVDAIIRYELAKRGFNSQARSLLANAVAQSAAYGIGTVALNASAKRWFLDRAYSREGVHFSAALNDLKRTDEMAAYIKDALRKGDALKMAAQKLSDKAIQKADVAKDIQALTEKARQLASIADEPELVREVAKTAKTVQKRINTLVQPDKSKLKRAYQDVIDAAGTASEKAVEKASEYAVYFKQRYNSERIIATESSRAYGKGFFSSIADDDDIIGWRSVLNTRHRIRDICDFWAESDLFGMGSGCFPKGKAPSYPYHPFCACSLRPIIAGDVKPKQSMDSEAGIKYLKSLPEETAKQLLGVRGYEKFRDNPSQWSRVLKNYSAPKKITGLIPEEVLHGDE